MRKKILIAAGLLAFVAVAVRVSILIYRAPPSEIVLQQDAVWSSSIVSNRVVVPAGITLTIQPGATVLFRPRAGLRIHGRLVAEGTDRQRIRLARERIPFYLWAGITFEDSQQDNRLSYVDVESAGSEGQYVHLLRSNVLIEHARFFGAQRTVVEAADSSFTLRRSVVDPMGNNEPLHVRRTPVGGHVLVEDNVFYPSFGYKDIIQLIDCRSPGAVPRIVNNLFLGGGDDGVDLNRSEAYIEGNIFVHFNLRGHQKYSDGISAANHCQLVVTNNLFVFNDQAVAVMKDTHALLVNNTFYRCRYPAVVFKERIYTPGGAEIVNCIFWQNEATFDYADVATQLTVSNSILPEADRWPGQGNTNVDPKFADAPNGDFRVRDGRGAAIPPERIPRFILTN